MNKDFPGSLSNVMIISSVLLILLVAVSFPVTAANAWVGGWKTIGDQNDAAKGLINPAFVSVDDGNVTAVSPSSIVPCIMNRPNGGTWKNLGTWDSTYGSSHAGVATDEYGNVYVLNNGLGTSGIIYEFVNNTLATSRGWMDITNPYTPSELYPAQQFYNPRAIASNDIGSIFVINMAVIDGVDHYEIIGNQIFGYNHNQPWYRMGLDVISNPVAITTDKNGDLYVLSGNGGIVKGHYDTYVWSCTWSNFGSSPAGSGIAVDYFGNVYVADPANRTIAVLPSGSTTWVSMFDGSPNAFIQPTGVAVDSRNSGSKIYVADFAGADTTYRVIEHQPFPSRLVWTAQPGGTFTGMDLAPQPVLALQDGNGNVLTDETGDPLTVTLTVPAGAALRGMTTVNLSSGVAAFSGLNVSKSGIYTLNATCGHLAGQSGSFTITDPIIPSVTAISPSFGPTAGGTPVNITGMNFTGATAVRFGSTDALSFNVNSNTNITAVSPPGSAGTVDITVTVPAAASAITPADRFTYVIMPVKNLQTGLNYWTIQAAINDGNTTDGHTIQVNSSTYKEMVTVFKAVKILGVDTGGGMPVVDGSGFVYAIRLTENGVTVQGLKLANSTYGLQMDSGHNNVTGNVVCNNTHLGINVPTTYNNLSGNTIYNNSFQGIYLTSGSSHNNVTGNTVRNHSHSNIYIYDSSYNDVIGNVVNNSTGDGIYLLMGSTHNNLSGNTAGNNGASGIFVSYADDNDVAGNTLLKNVYGIYLNVADDNRVVSNTASNNTQHGIFGAYADNCSYVLNQARYNSQYGLYITSSNNTTVDSNTALYNNIGIGVTYSDDCRVTSNTANSSIKEGFSFQYANHTRIWRNTAGNNNNGFSLTYSCTWVNASENTAANNANYGIYTQYLYGDVDLTRNTLAANGFHGIFATYTYRCNITSNTVNGNSRVGIYLSQSKGNNVSDNTASGNSRHGIYVYSASNDNLIAGNTVRNNANSGLYFAAASVNNSVTANTAGGNVRDVNVTDSTNNTFWLNHFEGNYLVQALSLNRWNSTVPLDYTYGGAPFNNYTGNYWGLYSGPDENGDGIGDAPYGLATSNIDYYPMNASPPALPVLYLSAGHYSANETDGSVTLTVLRSGFAANPVTVSYETVDDVAKAGKNYLPPSPNPSTLTIPAYAMSGTITIQVLDDHLFTPDKNFTVTISSPVNATLGKTLAFVMVKNTDPMPVMQFSSAAYDVDENAGSVNIIVTKTNDAVGPVELVVNSSDGTAHDMVNYGRRNVTMYFDEGEMSQTLIVPIIPDGIVGGDLTFYVRLTRATIKSDEVPLGVPNLTTVTIHNTDRPAVNFTSNVTIGVAPLDVNFTDTSPGSVTSRQWNFADGTPNATASSVAHTFEYPGIYPVMLTVTEAGVSNTTVGNITVLSSSRYPPALHGAYGNVTGRVSKVNAVSMSPVPGALVELVNASNVSEVYDTTTTDGSGDYVFTMVNATYDRDSMPAGTMAYKLRAFKEPFGDGYSASFGVDAGSANNVTTTVIIFTRPQRIELVAGRNSIIANGTDNVTITAFAYDVSGEPVADGYNLNFTVGNAAGNAWAGGFPWTADNGSLQVPGQRDAINIPTTGSAGSNSVQYGWVAGTVPDGDSTIWAYYADNASVFASVKIDIIEASPPPTDTYTVHLKQGWNLVSFPLVNYTITASSLGSIGATDIAQFNNTAKAFDIYMVGISTPEYDFRLRTDRGYFIKCDHDTSLIVNGALPDSRSLALCDGWNVIGWSNLTGSDASSVCERLSAVTDIARFNTTRQDFDIYMNGVSTADYDFAMHDGEGYFVKTSGNLVFPYGGS